MFVLCVLCGSGDNRLFFLNLLSLVFASLSRSLTAALIYRFQFNTIRTASLSLQLLIISGGKLFLVLSNGR